MLTYRTIIITVLTLFVALSSNAQDLEGEHIDQTTGMEFAKVQEGKFMMGDVYGSDRLAKPTHTVTVGSFFIGKYEVTFDQYDQFCDETKRQKPDDKGWGRGKRPVINVSWLDAVAFTEWLSKRSNKRFRLPSEAEWEYAARGGMKKHYDFPWGSVVGKKLANCDGCGSQWDYKMTAPVGSFAAHGYGLYDIIGNVYEWCLDTRHDSYTGAPTDGSAWIDPKQEDRVYKGGSWFQAPKDSRIVSRSWDTAKKRRSELGFRVLMELPK